MSSGLPAIVLYIIIKGECMVKLQLVQQLLGMMLFRDKGNYIAWVLTLAGLGVKIGQNKVAIAS